jgi:hypothetical protein
MTDNRIHLIKVNVGNIPQYINTALIQRFYLLNDQIYIHLYPNDIICIDDISIHELTDKITSKY